MLVIALVASSTSIPSCLQWWTNRIKPPPSAPTLFCVLLVPYVYSHTGWHTPFWKWRFLWLVQGFLAGFVCDVGNQSSTSYCTVLTPLLSKAFHPERRREKTIVKLETRTITANTPQLFFIIRQGVVNSLYQLKMKLLLSHSSFTNEILKYALAPELQNRLEMSQYLLLDCIYFSHF